MGRKKELLFNTIIIGIGKFSTQFISLLLLPLYTSILSTEEYGIYDLIITVSIFLFPIITMLMEESMFRFLIDAETEYEKGTVVSQTVIYTVVSTAIFSLLGLLIGSVFDVQNIGIIVIYIISTVILGMRNGLTRGFRKNKIIFYS